MNINPRSLDRHADHRVRVDLTPRNRQGQLITVHAASLRCQDCNRWLKWLSLSELAQLQDLIDHDEI